MKTGKNKRLVTPPIKSKHLKIEENYISLPKYNYPIFCLKNLKKKFDLDACDNNEKKDFAIFLVDLSKYTWDDIQHNDKYKFGSEKIEIGSLYSPPPTSFITPDIKHLLVIRKQSNMLIIGHRHQYLFHVIYIDPKLKAYKH